MVLTGAYPVLSQNGSNSFNNLKTYDMTTKSFSQFYGFTENDIKYYFLENLVSKDVKDRDDYINGIMKLMKE